MMLLQRFAEILDYPTPSLSQQVNECIDLLGSVNQEGTALLKQFRGMLERTTLGRMEQIYARTFDLRTGCHPHVGHYLFGEDYGRRAFIDGLKDHYTSYDFSAGKDLPDHLSVMLRFLSRQNGGEREELAAECVLPALKKMVAGFESNDNPYKTVVQALLSLLQKG
jgi:nitrate reductase molybdenum cofactor assembly chaperone NarJ/NarW